MCLSCPGNRKSTRGEEEEEEVTGMVRLLSGRAESVAVGWQGAVSIGVSGVDNAVDMSRPSVVMRLWS